MHHLLYFLGKRPPRSVVFLALLLAMLSWQPIFAASPPRMEKVTIGLPGANGTRFRTGQWAPVYVRLKASEEGNPQSQYELVLESTDFEEALYRYKVPVPSLRPKQEYTLLSYVHPGDETSEYSAWLQTVEGEKVQRLSKLRARIPGEEEVVAPRQVLFLAVGHKLSGLQKALNELDREEDKKGADGPKQPQMNNPRSEERRNRLAYIEEVNDLPDQWFGYEAVDVLVLCTAPSFLGPLVDEPRMESRRTALLEWVRRGGRLVLSVGKNTNGVTKLLSELRFLDCKINGSTRRDALPKFSRWSGAQQTLRTRDPFTIARLQPGSDVRVLLRESVSSLDSGERPMLVQGSCGLGRVLIVALDLDSPPFTEWRGSLDFWKRLHAQLVPRSPAPGGNQGTRGVEELGAQLKRQMETFPSIPVLSFGWVALFMLVYIVIVGPLDYLILKKLFKRLELTWITFPVLVITISLLAFFTAYFLKGDKILINKVDLVEYDYHNPERVYGTTWVTLFSPRMQT